MRASIRVEHAVTREALGPVSIELRSPVWPGWQMAERGDYALLVTDASDVARQPDVTAVKVKLDDPALMARLRPEGAAPPEPEASTCAERRVCELLGERAEAPAADGFLAELCVTPPPGAAPLEYVVRAEPAPSLVEIELFDERGQPIRGARVEVLGDGDAPAIELTEVSWACARSLAAGGALYRSCPPRAWDARYSRFKVVVDGTPAGDRTIDYRAAVTRHRLVTPRNHL